LEVGSQDNKKSDDPSDSPPTGVSNDDEAEEEDFRNTNSRDSLMTGEVPNFSDVNTKMLYDLIFISFS
jgi:hypothetical protein